MAGREDPERYMMRMMMRDTVKNEKGEPDTRTERDSHREGGAGKEIHNEVGGRPFPRGKDKMADETKPEIEDDVKEAIRREIRKRLDS